MRFAEPLVEGRLVERYKRFLADVDLTTIAIVPNGGEPAVLER